MRLQVLRTPGGIHREQKGGGDCALSSDIACRRQRRKICLDNIVLCTEPTSIRPRYCDSWAIDSRRRLCAR